MRSMRGSSSATLAGAVRPSSSSTPFAEAAEGAPVRLALDLDQVLLVDAEARVGEAVGQVAVVGEQQQALGVGVEPADGEHPGLGRARARPRWAGPGGRSAVVTTPAGLFSR